MRRVLVLVPVVVIALGACTSDGQRAAPPTHTSGSTTSHARPSSGNTVTLANPRDARFRLTPVAAVDTPTAMAVRKGDPALYVTEQVGRILAIRHGGLATAPVLDIRDLTSSGGERGLLGLAFSPDGATLYVDYTNLNGDTRVDAYPMTVEGTANRAARRELLAIAQPQPNHNGGNLVTGPDGMLWIATGDGGAAGDAGPGHAPEGNGQSLTTLLGKLLRIDPTPAGSKVAYTIPPDNPFARGGGLPEIWAYGLRNPWKFSFDATTGALVIGDVGQNAYEEIDWVAPGTRPPLNFGWPRREGLHKFSSDDASGTVAPIFDYPHDGRCSISGGYVYRGKKIPNLVGTYLFTDYCDAKIRGVRVSPTVEHDAIDFGIASKSVSGFGEGPDRELYVLSQGAGILRIDPA